VNRNSGFATVFIVIILSSLIILLLVCVEAASFYAGADIAEDISYVCGRSLLSEYQENLEKRYGIFAFKANSKALEELATFFIAGSTMGNGVVRLSLKEVDVKTASYSAINLDLFEEQVNRLGTLCLVKDAAEMISDLSLDFDAPSAEDAEANIDSLSTFSDAEYDEDGKLTKADSEEAKETRRQANELKERYKEATSYQFSPGINISDMKIDVNALQKNEYILNACSNCVEQMSDSYRTDESEYVIFGLSDYEKSLAASKGSIFAMRYARNMIEIYSDPAKLSEITAAASAAYFLIPQPVAVFLLASIEAGIKAKIETDKIFNGEYVELVKGMGYYKDYLRVMLLCTGRNKKLERLMDVMEDNIVHIYGDDFSFLTYAYGLDINVTYSEKSFLGMSEGRLINVQKTIMYQ